MKSMKHLSIVPDPLNASYLYSSDSDTEGCDTDGSSSSNKESTTSGSTSVSYTRQHSYEVLQEEYVTSLRPECVRWFYKETGDKKWTAFIGYDSLRIETKFLELQRYEMDVVLETRSQEERVNVRGGMYEVDVSKRTCCPIYWPATTEAQIVMRGLWYLEADWQPLDEEDGERIEEEHLVKFEGQKHTPEVSHRGVVHVLHNVQFRDYHVDWHNISQVFLHREATSSKLYRAVGSKLGFNKSGYPLRRGFHSEATMSDKPPDITHLIFVVHGIGQKMDTASIIRNSADLREGTRRAAVKRESVHDMSTERAEYLPVEWRSALKLDGDIVSATTPTKLKGIRDLLNSSVLDILYYSSPLYRAEIMRALQTKLNGLYERFCARNPHFASKNGKVSIIAHSLGCVIIHDIMTGWNPIRLYEQYVTSTLEDESVNTGVSTEKVEDLLAELKESRKKVTDLEDKLLSIVEEQHLSLLTFKCDSLFCLGSPLAVFLALRGVRPTGSGSMNHIIPDSVCSRIYNIYYPSDAVAYRLEPLIVKHFAHIQPLIIHRFDCADQPNYHSLPNTPIKSKNDKAKKIAPRETNAKENFTDFTEAKENSEENVSSQNTGRFGGLFSRWGSSKKSKSYIVDELNSLDTSVDTSVGSNGIGDCDSQAGDLSNKLDDNSCDDLNGEVRELQGEAGAMVREPSLDCAMNVEQTDLEYRVDYELTESKVLHVYISALRSHLSYWNNPDLALFIHTQLFPSQPFHKL